MISKKDLLVGGTLLLGSLGAVNYAQAQTAPPTESRVEIQESLDVKLASLDSLYDQVDEAFEIPDDEYVLLVLGEEQKMYLVKKEGEELEIHREYDVSTGREGFGTEARSYKTPTGIHKIRGKFGKGAPLGTVFKARQNLGRRAKIFAQRPKTPAPSGDSITTRIMWLDGCEDDNSNTHSRYIYIHGTNKEYQIGEPRSHGCIRMRNLDVVELFNLVPDGTYINIDGE